jgi:hypothetical protein
MTCALVALLAACSGGNETGGGGAGGEAGSGGSTAEPGVPVGHAPRATPPAHIVGGFGITVPAVTLMPGEEQEPCYIFPLEVSGSSRIVGGGKLTVGAGMHHGNITTRPKTGEGVRPCPADSSGLAGEADDILKGGAVLFGSSTQVVGSEWQSFPEGMGYRLRDGFEIVARMHYLNVSGEPITVTPSYEWYTVDEASITQELGPFAWTLHGFSIPPQSEATVQASCDFPEPMHVISVLPHVHRLGRRFTAGFLGGAHDGQLFLDSPGYDPATGVIVAYDAPGVDLSQGDGVTFGCTWKNTLDKTVVEGIGDNEMCILFGYAWPPEDAFSTTATEGGCVYVAPPAP